MAMLGSISRSKKSRQNQLKEVSILVSGGNAGGQDAAFISGVEKLSEGVHKISVKDKAQRNLIPQSIIPEVGYVGRIVASTEDSITLETRTIAAIVGTTAQAVIQDLTFDAAAGNGLAGNGISIEYVGGGLAGSEVVTVNGNAIEVEIEDGVSDADDIKAAIEADLDAAALVSITVSGVGGNAQTIQGPTFLAGGEDDFAAGDEHDADFLTTFLWHGDPVVY
ncbi:MAG: hypothetical protein QXX57_03065 [Nitrososphaerota archaeon]